jgi:predicted flap endonuclease-1-like 5' DNA nuclease
MSVRPPPTDLPTAIAELDHTKRVLASKLIELRKFQTEREALLQRISDRDGRIRELEASSSQSIASPDVEAKIAVLESDLFEAREVASRVPHLEAELAALHAKLRRFEAAVAERERRIGELESELGESLAWAAPEDDLKKIRGIGPKFERALHALGIKTFAQIASWTENDVASIAAKLKVHATRIQRDGWIEKAKELTGR